MKIYQHVLRIYQVDQPDGLCGIFKFSSFKFGTPDARQHRQGSEQRVTECLVTQNEINHYKDL